MYCPQVWSKLADQGQVRNLHFIHTGAVMQVPALSRMSHAWGLMPCSGYLEVLNYFVFEFVFWQQSPMRRCCLYRCLKPQLTWGPASCHLPPAWDGFLAAHSSVPTHFPLLPSPLAGAERGSWVGYSAPCTSQGAEHQVPVWVFNAPEVPPCL